MGKKGAALIIAFMVIVMLTVLGSATISKSVSERFLTQRYAESTQAFWLAEAGVAQALLQLKSDFSNFNAIAPTALGQGEYSIDTIVVEGANRRVTAHGFVPSQASPRAERTITVLVQSSGGSNLSNPDLLQYAVDTTGELNIGGSADIHPPESSHQGSSLDFEEVFGTTKEAIYALAQEAAASGTGHVYTNPGANQQPVNGITWVELTGSNKYSISSNWSGSGLLIVNGNGMNLALEITGDWTFTGMIWVMGKIKIAGNPQITGAIFAESMAGIESDVTGNPTINLDTAAVSGAFGLLGGGSEGIQVLSWREI